MTPESAEALTHRQKVGRLAEDLVKRGVDPRSGAPPLFRLLWKLGIKIPPPFFLRFLPLVFLFAIPVALVWGIFMWFFLGRLLPLPEGMALSITLKLAGVLALILGATLAAYFRWKANQLRLPRWADYPEADPERSLAAPPPRPIRSGALLFVVASVSAIALTLLGLKKADVFSIGSRPSPSAFHDFLLSISVGVALGVTCVAYIGFLYRTQQDFLVEFFSLRPWQRRSWRYRRWTLLYSLPILAGVEVFLILSLWREFPPDIGGLAAILCVPLLARPWENIRRLAQERRDSPATPIRYSVELTPREYSGRLALWLTVLAALAFTGYALMLPQRDENAQGRAFLKELMSHKPSDYRRFYRLTDQAQTAARTCDGARLAAAEVSAKELLRIEPGFTFDWNYGNAIHYGNLALGRLALRRGDPREAKRSLLKAGQTPGSPQLNDYGPDMTLARELLERHEEVAVLQYFALCNRFWKNETRNCIGTWADEVRAGQIPDFGKRAGPVPQPEKGWPCVLLEDATTTR